MKIKRKCTELYSHDEPFSFDMQIPSLDKGHMIFSFHFFVNSLVLDCELGVTEEEKRMMNETLARREELLYRKSNKFSAYLLSAFQISLKNGSLPSMNRTWNEIATKILESNERKTVIKLYYTLWLWLKGEAKERFPPDPRHYFIRRKFIIIFSFFIGFLAPHNSFALLSFDLFAD